MKSRVCRALLLCAPLALSVACATAHPALNKSQAPSLQELCVQYETDKCAWYHNYVELYDTFFQPLRKRTRRVLEIGVEFGESVRMWEAYFPRAEIFGIDINDSSQHDTERIHTFVADQANREQLSQFIEEHGTDFDIVIDDGGHSMEQQQVSFGFFFPHLRSGGLYIIEDIHTSFPDLYSGFGVDETGENSTFTMITNFIIDRSFSSQYMTPSELATLNSEVDHCLYSYRRDGHHSDFFLCAKK